jgi:hypothetical protein
MRIGVADGSYSGHRNRLGRGCDLGSGRLRGCGRGPGDPLCPDSPGRVAYQVIGDGPIDVLVAHSPFFPIDLMRDEPNLVRFLDRLSSFSRHVWFDPRGRGASDPLPHVEERFAEAHADDMLALLDHLGWEQVAIVTDGPPPILFAASHPERQGAGDAQRWRSLGNERSWNADDGDPQADVPRRGDRGVIGPGGPQHGRRRPAPPMAGAQPTAAVHGR